MNIHVFFNILLISTTYKYLLNIFIKKVLDSTCFYNKKIKICYNEI